MSVVPWSTLASTLWPLRATTSVEPGGGFYGRINENAVSNLVGADNAATMDNIVNTQIQRMANIYRQKLILRLLQVYPDTLPAFERQYERRKQAAREFAAYKNSVSDAGETIPSISLSFGSVLALSTSLLTPVGGVYGFTEALKPALYFFNSESTPINSDLLKDGTNPGDYAGDISPSATIGLYCNHGTRAVPVWVNANRNTLTDFISNPEEIQECGYQRAIAYVKSYATDMDQGDFEFRQEKMPTAYRMKREEATEAETAAFALIQIDRSGNGIISDFDRAATQVKKYFF